MDKSDNYKRNSIHLENIDVWMDWMKNNFDNAKNDYPEMMELLKETLLENPIAVSVKIEQIPENFPNWKNDIEICLKTTRIKKINNYLELIQGLLYHFKFPDKYITTSVEKIRPELLEMETYFTNQLSKGTKKQKKTSYVWQNNPDKELLKLYKLMLNKLIAPETTYKQFKAVFTGQPIDTIEPIKWHQDNTTELVYFNEAIKSKVNVVWDIYQRMAACFVKPDGMPFQGSFKEIKHNMLLNLAMGKQKAIDELLSGF